jgi:hypothetical protein
MPAKKSQLTNPWAAIDALMKTDPEPTSPEWFTIRQFAVRYGLTHGGAAVRLLKMERAKHVISWKGRAAGSSCIKLKYRLKP